MEMSNPTGARLRELRQRAGLTMDEMADAIGVTWSAWVKYERGERVPRDEIKVRIAEYFGVPVESIFFAGGVYK